MGDQSLQDYISLNNPPYLTVTLNPFAQGSLTLSGTAYSAEVSGIGDAYTAIETVIVIQPEGFNLQQAGFGLTGQIKSSGTLEGINWKWQASDDGSSWENLIAEQVRTANASAYADVTCSSIFVLGGNFLGNKPTFQVRMVAKSAVAAGETAAGCTKNSSYLDLLYRRA